MSVQMEGQRTGHDVLEEGRRNLDKPPKSSKTKEVNVSMEKGKKRAIESEDDSDDGYELTPAYAHTSKKQKDESDLESDLESEESESNSTSMALTSARSLPSGAWMYKSTAKQACEFGIGTAVGQGTPSPWIFSASILYLSAFSCTGTRIELDKALDR